MFDYVSDKNFIMFAIQSYDNNNMFSSEEEFHEDLTRIRSISRSFSRYRKTGEINERLVLNHLIILYNVFEGETLTKMLVFKLQSYLEYLKPFLMLIARWPEYIDGVFDSRLIGTDIPMDMKLVERLRTI
jgi:hypothetical protein